MSNNLDIAKIQQFLPQYEHNVESLQLKFIAKTSLIITKFKNQYKQRLILTFLIT